MGEAGVLELKDKLASRESRHGKFYENTMHSHSVQLYAHLLNLQYLSRFPERLARISNPFHRYIVLSTPNIRFTCSQYSYMLSFNDTRSNAAQAFTYVQK